MQSVRLPTSPLPELYIVEITVDRASALQRFFDANPLYFEAVNGEPAGPTEARDEILGELPAGWSFTKKWSIGYVDSNDEMVAMATVVSDLLVTTVWHIGLFIVASSRHGSGDAQLLYRGLETWAVQSGARWLRLGVVLGNGRAERFWERLGYIETRTRTGIPTGRRTNAVRVMVKCLDGRSLEEYLSLVERDRPDSQ